MLTWMKRIWAYFALDEGRMAVGRIQEEIERSIAETGFQTRHRKAILFGRQMLIHISPEAMEVLRPMRRYAIEDIEQHLPAQLRKQGWSIMGDELHIDLTVDPSLEGYAMRAVASDLDATDDFPADSVLIRGREGATRRNRTSNTFLTLVGDNTTSWEIPRGSVMTVGRGDSGVDISLDNKYVSALHAEVEGVQGGVMVTDRSRHGTSINGGVLRPDVSTRAKHGDVIKFASPRGVMARVTVGGGHLDITADLD